MRMNDRGKDPLESSRRHLAISKKSCYLLVTDFHVKFDGMCSGRRWRNKSFEKSRERRKRNYHGKQEKLNRKTDHACFSLFNILSRIHAVFDM